MKRLCLSFHTERLHDDKLWEKIKSIVTILERYKIQAVWFSINPAFVAYQQMGFSVEKWRERLRYLAEHGQIIEQHTHFYKTRKGDCDLSIAHIKKRLTEDRGWLEGQGYKIKGFVSGTWVINKDILEALVDLGYQYDCSARTFSLNYLRNRSNQMTILRPEKFNSLWEIPTTTPLKKALFKSNDHQIIYLHDYDLGNFLINGLLKTFIWFNRRAKFVAPIDLI